MSPLNWQLFISFFIFVVPLASLVRYEDYAVSWLPPMVLVGAGSVFWVVFIIYLAWLFIITPLRNNHAAAQVQQTGQAVEAEVVQVLPEASAMYAAGTEIRLAFNNLSGTAVIAPFIQVQSQSAQQSLEKGQSLTLYLNKGLGFPPFASPALKLPKLHEQSGFYVFLFAFVYCLISACLWFFVAKHQYSMSVLHPWLVTPLLGSVLLSRLSQYFTYNAAFLNPEVNQLILLGKSAQAEVIQVKETGMLRGERSELKFTLQFHDEKGARHTVVKTDAVQHTELHKSKETIREMIYLPDNPQVAVFADELGRARGKK